jgi:general secretion pathway protein D
LALVADEILGQTLHLDYTVDPAAAAKVSFRVDKKLTASQLLEAFETALSASDIVLVRDGESVLVTTRAKAKANPSVRTQGPARAGYQVTPLELKGLTPSEASKALDNMGLTGMVVMSNDKTGQFLIGGTAKELQTARDTLKLLDRGEGQAHSRWVTLRNTSPKAIADELINVASDANIAGLRVSPFPRLNQVLLFARSEADLDEAVRWINRLDVPGVNGASNTSGIDETVSLWVYKPKHVTAASLNVTLNALLGDGSAAVPEAQPTNAARPNSASTSISSTTSQNGTNGNPAGGGFVNTSQATATPAPAQRNPSGGGSTIDGIRVAVVKESNSLVIYAPPGKRSEIQKLLEAIDVPLRQVLIEASIVEVTLNNEFSMGVDWSLIGAGGKLNVVSSDNQSGSVGPTLPGIGLTYLSKNLNASLSALSSKTRVEVLSSPKIVALDNGVAHLEIGDQVPVATQSSQSAAAPGAPTLTSIDYRNTGVILDVTPRVTGDDSVTLTVSQEVSEVAKTTTSGIDSPTIQERQFDSTLLVQSGQTVALGGLISSNYTKGATGLPFLSNIPLLGQLFKTDTRSKDRTELIVLLTVTILEDPATAAKATEHVTSQMKAIDSSGSIKP